ncbi:S8 family serine peptidase [Mesorhizobium prunaredense]|nr:S8 family serine peptidase [Mesorhizobium prunaredense]
MTQVGTYKIPDDGIVEGSVLKVSANPEETLRELVDRVCGPEPERYFEALSESTGIPDPSFDEPMVGGEEIAIPLCSLDTVWYETTLVRSGDTLWSIFKSQPDVLLGGLPRWQFFEVPPGSVEGDAVNSGVFVEAFKALNPGKNPTALAIGDRILVPLAPASGTVHLAQKLAPQFGITPQLSLTDFELQSEDADCVRPASYENYPYSVQGLLDALQVNRIVMDEGRAKRIQTRVIIADSGLYQVGKSIFSWAVVPYPRDGNERKFANRVQPVYWPDEKMSHGTQVASLVLGGPTFGRFQALMKSSPVMVVPVRIYDVKESEFINPQTNERKSGLQRIVQQNAFDTVLKAAKDLDARIVNLSIKTASTIPEMEQDGFGEQSDILFVVAAGNGDGKIGRETTVTYPAVYGDHLNVLAVAALDGEGDVPVFSNWNSEFVHIAAPGCSVPVLSFEPATTRFFEGRWHGTSLSAPLVSFAAALVDSEAGGNLRPWQIKERLVVASDLDEKRADRVLDGRALDIPKASAIWVDAVETTKAPGLIFGAATIIKSGAPLKMESVLRFDCGEAGDLAIRVHQLRKLTPRFRNVNGKTFGKIYYQKVATGRLEGAACMVPDNLSVQFNDLLGGSSLTLSMTEIADIVPRMLPRYEPDQPN